MALGLSLGLGLGARSGTSLAAQVAALFGPSDTGWFYDNSDFSTLFQDSAGTIPVTAVGQSVGLQLDKSGNGNHRSQSVSLNRPTYARHPLGGIRNLLTYTEDFTNGAWSKLRGGTGVTPVVTNNAGLAPDGTNTAIRVVCDISSGSTSSDWSFIRQSVATTGVNRLRSFWIKSNTGLAQTIMYAYTGGTSQIVPTEWTFVGRAESFGAVAFDWGLVGGVTGQTLDVLIWHPQLENGAEATPYQRVGSVFDVTEAGQPDLYYLSYDGVNDSLATSAFAWGTDKATVVAGYTRKNNTLSLVCELSPAISSNAGSFFIFVNDPSGMIHASASRGSAALNISHVAGWTAAESLPTTSVISATHDIAGDLSTIRKNGVAGTNGTFDKGTGNFGNYPVYFGARGGTSLFFLGDEYSQFAINRLLTESELELVERYTNSRTGAY